MSSQLLPADDTVAERERPAFAEMVESLPDPVLVVSVDGQRRTIMLPPAMATMRPGAATFEDGSLEIRFSG